MSRDSGSYSETKSVIESIESRESGWSEMGPTGSLKTPYTGGKTSPTLGSFSKPGMGKMRKGME
jgi:hypothetical protein